MKKILFCKKIYSSWLILLIDQLIATFALGTSILIINTVNFGWQLNSGILLYFLAYNAACALVFVLMRIHTGIIRYSNLQDILRVFKAVLFSNLLFGTIIFLLAKYHTGLGWRWLTIMLVINFFVSASVLVVFRIGVKLLFFRLEELTRESSESIIIFGADTAALLLKHALDASPEGNFKIVGFIDDNPGMANKYIEQIKVYKSASIRFLKEKRQVAKLIVTEDCLDIDGRKKAIEQCLALGIRIISVPASSHWLKGNLNLSRLQDLKIEDLLQRDPILINAENVINQLCGKRILITGAAGSIGSEIVRQVLKYNPEMLIVFDQAESPLHEIQLEIEDEYPGVPCKMVVGNIQNYNRMEWVFETYTPQIVFHAAALKHVPMMEDNPSEAVLTNVFGTKNLADLSLSFGVDEFIMISTDKAVKPTNVMGASKRIAEMYIQSLQNHCVDINAHTRFVTTRFGNVLGSNGSVVPRFKSQLKKGGPITVTHPDITRYFMTIPEAVQLVLEASAMGKGGEIFIFDMGEPVKIVDLAIKMIKLAGFTPDEDIKITFTGLRPGEKLYEELLNQAELILPTHNEKIKISNVIHYPHLYVQRVINELLSADLLKSDKAIVNKMKEIVPDYHTTNPNYRHFEMVNV